MAEKRLIDANALLEKADWYEEYNEITDCVFDCK